MVTNDVKQAAEKRPVECFVVDVKGKVLSHGWVFEVGETLYFVSFGANQAERLLAHWDRYIIREDVVISDVSELWLWQFLLQSDVHPVAETDADTKTADNLPCACIVLSEHNATRNLRVALTNDIIGSNYWLVGEYLPKETTIEANAFSIDSVVTSPAAQLNDSISNFEAKRIEHRLPLIGIDFDDKNLPQELDRDAKAISFKKGCYLGQETVARLDALGQVQKKLVRLRLERKGDSPAVPSAADKLFVAEKETGWLTSVSTLEPNQWMALGYVRRSAFANGSKLTADGFEATVVSTF